MMRKALVLMVGVSAALFLWAGVASAQASPPTVLPSSTVQVQGEALVRTGIDVMPMIYTSIGLFVIGVALAMVARRRRHQLAARTAA